MYMDTFGFVLEHTNLSLIPMNTASQVTTKSFIESEYDVNQTTRKVQCTTTSAVGQVVCIYDETDGHAETSNATTSRFIGGGIKKFSKHTQIAGLDIGLLIMNNTTL